MSYITKPIGKRNRLVSKEEAKAMLERVGVEKVDKKLVENKSSEVKVSDYDEEYIMIENIKCYDADDNIVEQYDKILFMKDLIKSTGGSPKIFTQYQAYDHFNDKKGLFIPCFGLSCNIMAALLGTEFEMLIDQYLTYTSPEHYHIQNTITDCKNNKIIHYPQKDDFKIYAEYCNPKELNKRIILDTYGYKGSDDISQTLKSDDGYKFVKNLTLLKNPEVLIEIGKCFGRRIKIFYKPGGEIIGASWFSNCNELALVCSGNPSPVGGNCVRGVKLD